MHIQCWHIPLPIAATDARRGKNIYQTIWKDETVRTMVSAQVDSFKSKWASGRSKAQANLMPEGLPLWRELVW